MCACHASQLPFLKPCLLYPHPHPSPRPAVCQHLCLHPCEPGRSLALGSLRGATQPPTAPALGELGHCDTWEAPNSSWSFVAEAAAFCNASRSAPAEWPPSSSVSHLLRGRRGSGHPHHDQGCLSTQCLHRYRNVAGSGSVGDETVPHRATGVALSLLHVPGLAPLQYAAL